MGIYFNPAISSYVNPYSVPQNYGNQNFGTQNIGTQQNLSIFNNYAGNTTQTQSSNPDMTSMMFGLTMGSLLANRMESRRQPYTETIEVSDRNRHRHNHNHSNNNSFNGYNKIGSSSSSSGQKDRGIIGDALHNTFNPIKDGYKKGGVIGALGGAVYGATTAPLKTIGKVLGGIF
jgi:hypothetical protein